MTQPVCKKCLLSELDSRLAENIEKYVSLIPEEKRVGKEIYQSRLGVCEACPSNGGGLCGECGCFTAIRAARAEKGCPLERWADIC